MSDVKRLGEALILPLLAFLASIVVVRSQVGDLRDDAKICRENRQAVGERLGRVEGKIDLILERLPRR